MFKKLGIGCGGLLLLFIVIAVASSAGSRQGGTPTSPPLGAATNQPAAGAPASKTWVVVKQFTGDGIKDTEQFTVGAEWRIDWDYTPPSSGGIIQIYLYDSSNSLVGVAANTQKAGADTSFQHRAGTYYLKMNATGSWKVAIQDNR